MTKIIANKLSPEEEAYLAELSLQEANTSKALPQMKQLVINEDKVNEAGEKIEPDTWNIRGENAYSATVDFQPLVYKNKFIRMVQDGKRWKIENESIFVNVPWDSAYDSMGTIACGRIVGKTPDNWTEAQNLANFKKATIYGFMFGLVTFPGKLPELVNFRAAPGKSKVIRAAFDTMPDGYKMFQVPFKMTLASVKGEKFPVFTMEAQLEKANKAFGTLIPYIKESDSFIAVHNDRIMERRKNYESRLSGAATYATVKSLADDFNTDEEIPFGKEGIRY